MAHVGQEHALAAIRLFSDFLGQHQRILNLLSLGNFPFEFSNSNAEFPRAPNDFLFQLCIQTADLLLGPLAAPNFLGHPASYIEPDSAAKACRQDQKA